MKKIPSPLARAASIAAILLATSWFPVAPVSAQSGDTSSVTVEELEQRLARAIEEQELLLARIRELELAETHSDVERDELERRLEELERARRAQEDATRSIIRQALDKTGSRINEFVVLGGTFEVLSARQEDYLGLVEVPLVLNTLELDFEVQVHDLALAKLVLEYNDGSDFPFRSVEGDEATTDRINVDTAFLTLGDRQRYWPSFVVGQMIAPFGISTGEPVADVLTIEDPLTIEMFETKEVAVLLEVSFPTPKVRPELPIPGPPPVKPKLIAPIVGAFARATGYKPYPQPSPKQHYFSPTPPVPLFSFKVYTFDGTTFAIPKDEERFTPTRHLGAAVGFQKRGGIWSLELDGDWTSSVFDSDFLQFEYRTFLDQIGIVPGAAGNIKATLGPFGFVGEWNGALEETSFLDDNAVRIRMQPQAWQGSIGFQFGWNRTVEAIGAQGTYLALGYSESRDMAGATRIFQGLQQRVGFVPRRRFLASFGEWVLDGVRLAVEYSYIEDYSRAEGGTGGNANGITGMVTMEW